MVRVLEILDLVLLVPPWERVLAAIVGSGPSSIPSKSIKGDLIRVKTHELKNRHSDGG